MSRSRRRFFKKLASVSGGLLTAQGVSRAQTASETATSTGNPPESPDADSQTPLVETPDLPKLPWKMVDGVKEFHLVAEPVKRSFIPGREADVWGFNGSMPGPTIEINEGDRIRIIVDNHLPEITSIHWHGLELPIQMDGVPGVTQDPIQPGGRFIYEYTVHQYGTFFYHSHMPMQEMMGMVGWFIIHPKEAL